MTFEEFEIDLAAKLDAMTDDELMGKLREVGCKFIGDEELESQEQYKESLKHDY